MADVTFGVRIKADGSGFVGSMRGAEQSVASLVNAIKGATSALETNTKATIEAGRRTRETVNESASSFESLVGKIGAATRGIVQLGGAGLVLRTLKNYTTEFSSAMIAAQTNAEKLQTTLKFATGGNNNQVRDEINFVIDTSKRLGLELNSASRAYASLAAASKGTALEGAQARQIFLAVAEASTVMGLSAEEANGALLAVQQMISKGTVQAEELRGQLGERLPGAFQIAARSMGMTTQELGKMLEQGQIVASDFLPKFAAQLRKELGGSVPEALNNTSVAINRVASSWELLKRETAQSGIGKFIAGQLLIAGDAFDDIASRIKKAREQGSGFWGSMAAGAAGLARFLNPVNAVSYSPAGAQAQRDSVKAEIDANAARLAALNANGRPSLADQGEIAMRISKLRDLAEEYRKLGDAIGDAGDKQLAPDNGLDLRIKRMKQAEDQAKAFRKWELENGTLADRWQGAQGKVNQQFGALSPADYNKAMEAARREVYGPQAFNRSMAREQNLLQAEADNAKLAKDALKAAYEDAAISAQDYYNAVAAVERNALDTREKSLQRELALLQRESVWTDKTADIERVKGQLEEVGRQRVAITQRVGNEVNALEKKQGEELLALMEDQATQRGDVVQAAMLRAVKQYGPKIKEALAAGRDDVAKAFQDLINGAVNRAQFDEVKNKAEALFSEFARKLEEVKAAGGEEGGLSGALGISRASQQLREQFMPQIAALLAQMRQEAGSNPVLVKAVDEFERKFIHTVDESKKSWKGLVDYMGNTFVDGIMAALDGGTKGFSDWLKSIGSMAKRYFAEEVWKEFLKPAVNGVLNGGGSSGGNSGGWMDAVGRFFGGDGTRPASAGGNTSAVGSFFGMFGGSAAQTGGGFDASGNWTDIPLYSQGASSAAGMGGASWGASSMGSVGLYGMAGGVAGNLITRGLGAGERGVKMGTNYAAMGAMLGSYFGPIGAIIGAVAGALIGKFSDPDPDAERKGKFGTNPTGNYSFSARSALGTFGTFDDKWFSEKDMGEGMNAFLSGQAGFEDMMAQRMTPEQLARVKGNLAAPMDLSFGMEHTDFSSAIASMMQHRMAIIFDELEPSVAKFIRGFTGKAEDLANMVGILASVDIAKFPPAFRGIIESFSGTADQLTNVVKVGQAWAAIHEMTGPGYAQKLADTQLKGMSTFGAYQQRGLDLAKLIDQFNSGKATVEQLTAATQDYVAVQAQLLVEIEQTKQALHGMFTDTIREFTLATMTDQGKFDYYQKDAEELRAKIANETDPEKIRQYAQQINQDMTSAFNLLSPEDQARYVADFIKGLKTADELVNQRLTEIGAEVNSDNGDNPASVLHSAASAIDSAADKIVGAADSMTHAADTINGAADTLTSKPAGGGEVDVNLNVTVTDNRVTVSEVGG